MKRNLPITNVVKKIRRKTKNSKLSLINKLSNIFTKRLPASVLVLVILASILYPVLSAHHASAFVTRTDSDWSGGQNTQATNNVDTSNPGHITLGNSGVANWCNTANCDTSFTSRQRVNIKSDQSRTNYQVLLDVPYMANMRSDYADLRFTTLDGTTDLNYFNRPQSNGSSRKFFVKIPTLSAGINSIYMYYGNSSASSTSSATNTLAFSDNFASATVDSNTSTNTSNLYFGDTTGFSISNGKLHQDGTSPNGNGFGPSSGSSFNRNDPMAIEFQMKWISNNCTGNNSCGSIQPNLSAGSYPSPWNLYGFGIGPSNADFVQNSQPSSYSVNIMSDINPSGTDSYRSRDVAALQSKPANSDTFTYRLSVGQTDGNYAWSSDSGGTFTNIAPPTNMTGVQDGFGANFYMNQAGVFDVEHIYTYKFGATITSTFSSEESVSGQSGSLTSAIIDLGAGVFYGNVHVNYSGGGTAKVRIRNSNNSNLTGSPAIEGCGDLSDGDLVKSSSCFTVGGRYVQYQVFLSDASPASIDVTQVSIEYVNDLIAPNNPTNFTLKRSSNGEVLSSDDWVNQKGYISWDAPNDNAGGSGVAGYCVYLGTSTGNDASTNSGILDSNFSPLGTGVCPYSTTSNIIDLSQIHLTASLIENNRYYVNVIAFDQAGNIATSNAGTIQFRYDNTPPEMNTVFNGPATAVNTLKYPINWIKDGVAYGDNASGFAGIKYCVTNLGIGASGCDPTDDHWYGLSHNSAGKLNDTSDVVPFSNGTFSLTDADASREMMNGINFVIYAAIDNAGNAAVAPFPGIVTVTSDQSASAPQNLTVSTPPPNTNSYSFTWTAPVNYVGPSSSIDYCWSVNVLIASDAHNCQWTGAGITQLAAGPYATKQGVNTLYVIAKDQTGNFSSNNYASIDFNASTVAPGVPQNLEVTDVSTRATSTWKLALSWSAPSGGSVDNYKVLRSTDGNTYTTVGSTSDTNLSFIDSGLSQIPYYYQVKACDNAGSCGISVSPNTGRIPNQFPMTPTGRYTEPAKLTADTDQPKVSNVGTRKATISWFTDRNSDSKIAFGIKTNTYFSSEVSNSSQITRHEVELTNLLPNTTYYYKARWTDSDGNTGSSTERTFTTLPAPSISEVTPKNLAITSTEISFQSKDASKVKIYYGKSDGFGGLMAINTSTELSTYTGRIENLDDGTKYFFRINGIDADGNEYSGDTYTFTTPARPRITNIKFQPVENAPSSTQKISWTTNVPATSEMQYGSKKTKTLEALDSKLVVNHELIIQDLEDDTDYQLTVISRDDKGNVATSEPQIFRTALDTRPPKITDLNVETSIRGTGTESKGQLVISWKTDEKSTSQVAFGAGQSGSFTSRTSEDSRLTTDHVVIVSDLPPSSIYHIQAISLDNAKNASNSEVQSAIIGRGSDNVFSIIFNALQKIFGVKS